jgi:hypothetical protein
MLRHLLIIITLLLARLASADMVALDDKALGEIQGKQGIALDIQLALNGNPVPVNVSAATAGSNTTYGGPLASLSSCTGVPNPCYVALEFANRTSTTLGKAQFLVFKDAYFDMLVNSLHLDVGALKEDSSGSGYFDSSVFTNLAASGTQCAFSAGCTTTTLNGQHALMLSFHCGTPPTSGSTCQAGTLPSYNSGTKVSTGYTDIMLSEGIGRMAVEFTTNGSSPNLTTAPTNATDSNGSFIGLAVHDNNSNFAGLYVGGRAYIYGF